MAKDVGLVVLGGIITIVGQGVNTAFFADKHDLAIGSDVRNEAGQRTAEVTIGNQGNVSERAIRGFVDIWGVGLESQLQPLEGEPPNAASGLSVIESEPQNDFVSQYAIALDRLNPGESVVMSFVITDGQLHSILSDVQSDTDSDAFTWHPPEQ